MPQTMMTTNQGARIIGATFLDRANAEKAVEALQEMGISPLDIQLVVQLSTHFGQDLYATLLSDRGFNREDAQHYDKLIREGRTLVAVYDVIDPGPVIDVLDEYQAELNPDGCRNIRDDGIGMTAGVVAGAAEHRK